MSRIRALTLTLICLASLAAVWLGCWSFLPSSLRVVVGVVLSICGATLFAVYLLVSRLSPQARSTAGSGQESPAARPVPIAPSGDADLGALKALLADANDRLARSPTLARQNVKAHVTDFPLYLLVGAEGSGKSSTFVQSGVEPELLAGQVYQDAGIAPTRLCNLWFVSGAIVAEASGRFFSEEPGRWVRFLGYLRRKPAHALLRRLWSGRAEKHNLRGVILCCDVSQFVGIPDATRQAALLRNTQERLRLIGEAFGADYPVYLIFTKADSIPYFRDYFGRLIESEARQVVGCSLQLRRPEEVSGGEVYAEAESKRLGAAFNDLYHWLARRRLDFLARETDPSRKPGIYEFPRELKRLRSILVQFLVDACRPNPLQPGPLLRGFYFTGTRQVVAVPGTGILRGEQSQSGASGATRLLRAEEMLQMRRAASETHGAAEQVRSGWSFVAELFTQAILGDQGTHLRHYSTRRFDLLRRLAFGSLLALSVLLLLLVAQSWWNNRVLLQETQKEAMAVQSLPAVSRESIPQGLDALDRLLKRVQELAKYERQVPWKFDFLLYSGDSLLLPVRKLYFARFREYLLKDAFDLLTGRLAAVSATQDASYPYQATYDELKAYLSMTGGGCQAERPLVPRLLDQLWTAKKGPGADGGGKAYLQFDFYAAELGHGRVPFTLGARREAIDRSRAYLNAYGGEERIYRTLLDDVNRSMPPARLADYSPNYAQVLAAVPGVPGAYTRDGWAAMEDRIKKVNSGALGESCVLGGQVQGPHDVVEGAALEGRLRDLYVRNYIAQWKEFLAGARVLAYRNAGDAVSKLSLLEASDSPLLGLLLLVRDNTQFPVTGVLGGPGRTAQVAARQGLTADNIGRTFQPAQSLFTKEASRSRWVDANNQPYIQAVAGLRKAMSALGQAGPQDSEAANVGAGKAVQDGMDAVTQLSYRFERTADGVDEGAKNLLRAPFEAAKGLYESQPGKAAATRLNTTFKTAVCAKLTPLLKKYPFDGASDLDAGLDELTLVFSPQVGALWNFYNQNLVGLMEKKGNQWVVREGAKPAIDPEFLRTFNRMSVITDALFADRGPSPRMTFRLSPRPHPSIQGMTLTVDGQIAQSGRPLSWPGPAGSQELRLQVRIGDAEVPFASYTGLWSVFQMMADADPRASASREVALTYLSHGRRGRPEPVLVGGKPITVRLEVQEFPGGVEAAFDKTFFTGLRCPPRVAVE